MGAHKSIRVSKNYLETIFTLVANSNRMILAIKALLIHTQGLGNAALNDKKLRGNGTL